MVRVNGHGNIHADGWRAYVNHALAHYTVGLEFRDPEVRVWFFDVLLGAFDPRTQQSARSDRLAIGADLGGSKHLAAVAQGIDNERERG